MDHSRRLAISPCAEEASARIADGIGCGRVLADAMARRGWDDPDALRAFLDAEGPLHDPLLLGDAARAVELIADAVGARRRIVVHGDYDADGVCATALLTEGLTALGADVRPFIPSRFDEGYGLAVETVERLHGDGVEVLITVDCGITAVAAAARAAELGVDLVVTDHHRHGDDLPACPVLAPALGRYPFDQLCGAGTAFKLLEALVARLDGDPAILEGVADLVAIATVADLVPLVGENRALARWGLRRIAAGGRLGLDTLMRVAKVDARTVDAGAIGFRIGPRLNAAGRLEHADAALRLLMTQDPQEAHELAEELDGLNRRRRALEDRILREALAQHEALPEARRSALGTVLSQDGWHAGVVGIVASRVVERLRRPAVLVAIDGDTGRGSGRSVEAFDLHAALAVCDPHLERWGGHRAAVGVTVAIDRLDAFTTAFEAHATEVLTGADLRPVERIDAVVALTDVSLETAQDLARLEPVGMGNPPITVLVPAAELDAVRRIGAEGRHLDMRVRTAAGSCRCVAWSHGEREAELAAGGRVDVAARIERNVWQGAERVELVARAIQTLPDDLPAAPGICPTPCDASCPHLVAAAAATVAPADGVDPAAMADRRDGGAIAELTRLAATGQGLLVVVADVARRRAMLDRALHPARFGLRGALLFSRVCSETALDARTDLLAEGPFVALVDHDTLALRPRIAAGFPDAVLLDPGPAGWRVPAGPRWTRLDGPAERAFAERARATLDAA
ncbi:MAG: single-stranded-DNA-specific exonuclease RecJ [Actinobacteria bacterium]|nr:single-stranded-DNA-specific exonuclease RecJ [Actinomycetota bacterium]